MTMMSPASSPTGSVIRLVQVLLADDTAHVRRELRHLLELSGMVQVIGEAGNGLEAVRLAAQLSPEVIVMDLEMPVMDGFEATRQIKKRQPSSRVIILSVHAGVEIEAKVQAAGADCFILKGTNYQTLVNTILSKGEKS